MLCEGVGIIGTGAYLPEKINSNSEIEKKHINYRFKAKQF